MEKSLDELTEFLLGEIATCGAKGASLYQLCEFVKTFYHAGDEDQIAPASSSSVNFIPTHTQNVDQAFIYQTWKWLAAHSDISIGQKKQYNQTPLSDFWPASNEAQAALQQCSSKTPKILVNEDRILRAICGQRAGTDKVHPTELVLLTHIASAGRDGLLQGELIQASGQDKRSVPKRTDRLHSLGYIVKEPVYIRGMKTSQLVLKKYVPDRTSNQEHDGRRQHLQSSSGHQSLTTRDRVDDTGDTLPSVLEEATQLSEASSDARALWNPDRVFANTLSDAVRVVGETGLTHVSCRSLVSGPFLRRPVENYLSRLSSQGLISQPSHLQHLAIVRTTKLIEGSLEYAYFPTEALAKVEKNKKVNYPTIPGRNLLHPQRSSDNTNAAEDDTAGEVSQLDQFGFPKFNATRTLVKNSNASLAELIAASDAVSIPLRQNKMWVTQTEAESAPRMETIGPKKQKKGKKRPVPLETPERVPRLVDTANVSGYGGTGAKKSSGRPRKFAKGTEKFWRRIFSQVQKAAMTDDSPSVGTMKNPDAQALFEARPPGFDEVAVAAEAAELPLPPSPDAVSEQWIEKTRAVLTRSVAGAYITPAGLRWERTRKLSRMLIVRSDRLPKLDFNSLGGIPRFRFLTSSVAHSFTSPADFQRPEVATKSAPGDTKGPRKGVFLDAATNAPLTPQPEQVLPTPLTASEYRAVMDETDSDHRPLESASPPGSRRESQTSADTGIASSFKGPEARHIPSTTLNVKESSSAALQRPRSSRKRKQTQKAAEAFSNDGQVVQSGASEEPSLKSAEFWGARRQVEPADANGLERGPSDRTVQYSAPEQRARGFVGELQLAADAADLEKRDLIIEEVASQAIGIEAAGTNAVRVGIPMSEQPATDSQPASFRAEGVVNNHGILLDSISSPSTVIQADDRDRAAGSSLESSQSVSQPPTTGNERSITPGLRQIQADSHTHAAGNDRTLDVALEQAQHEPEEPHELSLSASDDEDIHSFDSTSRSPTPIRASTTQSSKLCREIVLDMVRLVLGAAPYEPLTFARVMTNRWQVAGGGGAGNRPARKLVQNALKALITSGKLRRIGFSFRSRRGGLLTKAIVALPRIKPDGKLVAELKTKMIATERVEYVPPEWEAETLPSLNAAGRSHKRMKELEAPPLLEIPRVFATEDEDEGDDDDTGRDPGEPANAEPARSAKKRQHRRSSASSDALSASSSDSSTGSFRPAGQSRSASPEEAISASAAFLTLKVPSLGRLSQVREFNANLEDPHWMVDLRVRQAASAAFNVSPTPVPLRSNTQVSTTSATALRESNAKSRRGLRRKAKGKRFDPITHEIITNGAVIQLPESLQAIVDVQQAHDPSILIDPEDEQVKRLFIEFDLVDSWECRNEDKIMGKMVSPVFINHTVPKVQPPTCTSSFWIEMYFHNGTIIVERPNFAAESWPVFITALQEAEEASRRENEMLATPKEGRARRKRRLSLTHDDYASPAPTTKRQKTGGASRSRYQTICPDGTPGSDDVDYHDLASQYTRAAKLLKKNTPQELYRTAITIICVRTLTSGLEKDVDWSIAMRLLPSYKEQDLLRECWAFILDKYRTDIRSLTENLQEKYIEALEADDVPTIKFDDLQATKWKDIVSWAIRSLDPDASKKRRTILPASRSAFLTPPKLNSDCKKPSLTTLLRPNLKRTNQQRHDIYASTLFGTRFHPPPSQPSPSPHPSSSIQSLLLSIILCPTQRYSQPLAKAKWTSIAPTESAINKLVRPVLKSLENDAFIARNVGDGGEGARQYSATGRFWEVFEGKNCFVTADMLREAAGYKNLLDEVFAKDEDVEMPKEDSVEAGKMVAIMQLLGMGAVGLKAGNDVPASRYGVAPERVGHQHAKLRMDDFGFGVVVQKTKLYVFGDAAGKNVAVNIPVGDAGRWDRTPMWVDVHGVVVKETWETVLGSVLGIASVRPGVAAEEVSTMLSSVVSTWEITLMLEWAAQMNFVSKTTSGLGWETQPWWWLCLHHSRTQGLEATGEHEGLAMETDGMEVE